MEFTLVPSSGFMSDLVDLEVLRDLFGCGCFARFELPLKTGDGCSIINDKVLRGNVECFVREARRCDVGLVFSVSAFSDERNESEDVCVYEAVNNGRVEVLNRICPNSKYFLDNLGGLFELFEREYGLHDYDIFQLSFFRYKNHAQCVCDKCLKEFSGLSPGGKMDFRFSRLHDLLNDNEVFRDWVDWRQSVLQRSLEEAMKIIRSNCLLEIDYELNKRYLMGPYVEEGLNYYGLANFVSEFYLHIWPSYEKSDSRKKIGLSRDDVYGGYARSLKYLISRKYKKGLRITPFLFVGNTEKEIKIRLDEFFRLNEYVGFKSVALHTAEPVVLSGILKDRLYC